MSLILKKLFLLSILSLALGTVGLFLGANLGGNFGFPNMFGGLVGYEAAGVFFLLFGVCLGSLLGAMKVFSNDFRILQILLSLFTALLLSLGYQYLPKDNPWSLVIVLTFPVLSQMFLAWYLNKLV